MFQSTRPAWGATEVGVWLPSGFVFQSTRPAWGATGLPNSLAGRVVVSIHAPRVGRDCEDGRGCRSGGVSIHAPRVGRDGRGHSQGALPLGFNPRAPRGARRQIGDAAASAWLFQSTRPAWGATIPVATVTTVSMFQSTRPAWGATRILSRRYRQRWFQSTRPAWGATRPGFILFGFLIVSIHAPRVGRDISTQSKWMW